MVSTCHLKCVGPYGVHVSPKMCGPLCIHLRNPLQNQWQNDWKSMNIYVGGCLLSHVGSRWHLLEAILAQDDREDRFVIDFWSYFAIPKWYKNQWKMKWFSDTLKNRVFCTGRSQRLQNWAPKTIQNQAFSEPAKTTESCSRLHAELVFEVWRAPKPHFFRDHFRNPSSCCTGAVVSQIFVENDTPESVQNPSKILSKMKQETTWKNNVKSGGGGPK